MKYDFIRESAGKKQVTVNNNQRLIHLNNTNRTLMFELNNVVMSKTGFTRPAGWCVVMVVEQDAETYVVVVLGSATPISRAQAVKMILTDPKQHQPTRETSFASWFRAFYQSQ
jgi:D-alanyl-D-alanine carboxypeptidase